MRRKRAIQVVMGLLMHAEVARRPTMTHLPRTSQCIMHPCQVPGANGGTCLSATATPKPATHSVQPLGGQSTWGTLCHVPGSERDLGWDSVSMQAVCERLTRPGHRFPRPACRDGGLRCRCPGGLDNGGGAARLRRPFNRIRRRVVHTTKALTSCLKRKDKGLGLANLGRTLLPACTGHRVACWT